MNTLFTTNPDCNYSWNELTRTLYLYLVPHPGALQPIFINYGLALYKTYDADTLPFKFSTFTVDEWSQFPWMPFESITGIVGPKSDLYSLGEIMQTLAGIWGDNKMKKLSQKLLVKYEGVRMDHAEVIRELNLRAKKKAQGRAGWRKFFGM